VDAVLARDLVAEPDAAGRDRRDGLEAREVVPRRAETAEGDRAEALPELPAQLGLYRGGLVALVAHDRRAAQADERLQIEGRVAEDRRGVAAQPEVA
jgi:hypothetical protein